MKPASAAIACMFGILLAGCAYSSTRHKFEFYGSTQESYGRDFFYVQYGVIGSATASYTSRGGGHVRDGLIADAKSNLIKAHPLGPNQSYVNMSIDISQTDFGSTTSESTIVNRVDLTATISADVIQFGEPPLGYSLPSASNNVQMGGKSLSDTPKSSLAAEELESLGELMASGSVCYVRYADVWYEGSLEKYGVTNGGSRWYRVTFKVGGKEKSALFKEKNFSSERPAEMVEQED